MIKLYYTDQLHKELSPLNCIEVVTADDVTALEADKVAQQEVNMALKRMKEQAEAERDRLQAATDALATTVGQQLREIDTLRERLAAVEKDVLLYAAKHARCEERLAEVVIALQQIAEDGCKMPWGIACQRTTGGEQWCEGCIAEAALAKASESA